MCERQTVLKNEGRVLALDYGTVRIGLALSDPLRIIAGGAGVLPNDARLLDRMRALVATEGVSVILVGVPYAPDGGLGAKGEEVSKFVDRLRSVTGVPVETWDESRTSVEASAILAHAGMKKKKREAKGSVDEMAARLLLQEYLDHHASSR